MYQRKWLWISSLNIETIKIQSLPPLLHENVVPNKYVKTVSKDGIKGKEVIFQLLGKESSLVKLIYVIHIILFSKPVQKTHTRINILNVYFHCWRRYRNPLKG